MVPLPISENPSEGADVVSVYLYECEDAEVTRQWENWVLGT